MKHTVHIVIFLLLASAANAQKSREWIALGDQATSIGDWYAAHECYREAFVQDSTDFDFGVKYAESLRMIKDYEKAEFYYHKLFYKDKGKIFPMGQFWLANMQKSNGNYKEALRNFKKFSKKQKRDKEGYLYRKSMQEIESCTWAITARRDDSEVIVKNVGEPVNTKDSEFGPWLSKDSVLYFSGPTGNGEKRTKGESIQLFSTPFDSAMTDPVKRKIIDGYQYANLSFSPSSDLVYFSQCDDEDKCRICSGTYTDTGVSEVKELAFVNSEGYTSTMPFVAVIDNEEVLFYSSDRPGGEGKLDVWWSELDNGQPKNTANAGKTINTPDNEVSPFYLNGNLYFSSEWHNGFGQLDVFKSEGKHRAFNEPENLGYPINTSSNDLYYKYFPEALTGFVVSNRAGSYVSDRGTCCNDIYTLQYTDSLNPVEDSPYASLDELSKYLPVTLYFHNDEPNPDSWDTTTTLSYAEAYTSYVKLKSKYKKENGRDLSGDEKEDAEYEVDEFFQFFVDKGMYDLEVFSKLLLEELKEGVNIELIIRGFASPRAQSDYNVNLTKRRTASLVNYLRDAKGGAFIPFIEHTSENHGTLDFVEIPYGEFEADEDVSDELFNEKASIYSRGARLERKIMIESVKKGEPDSLFSEMSIDYTEHDFGEINALYPVQHIFDFKNTGTDTLFIDSVAASCGCTVPKVSSTIILPGEVSEIEVEFDPEGRRGEQVRTVLIYTSEGTEPRRITITANVQ